MSDRLPGEYPVDAGEAAWVIGGVVELGVLLVNLVSTIVQDPALDTLTRKADALHYKTEVLQRGVRSIADRRRRTWV